MIRTGIRPYTLGKFRTNIDEIMWSASLSGYEDDSYGDSDLGVYVSITWVPLVHEAHEFAKELGYGLNYEEISFLARHQFAIIESDSQGFVYIEYFKTVKEARDRYDAARDAFYRDFPEED